MPPLQSWVMATQKLGSRGNRVQNTSWPL